jgi:rhodanese-related sulfurtransferase
MVGNRINTKPNNTNLNKYEGDTMNELRKLFYLLLIIPILFINTGCSEDDDDPEVIIEAEVLAKYLEGDGGMPLSNFAAMITATDVNNAILANDQNQVVLDIRSATDFAAGHIKGAVNVASTEVLKYYEDNNLQNKTTVVLACYSGQTAGWATGLMHTMGYTNVKDLKFGMCSWNAATSSGWVSNTNMASKGNRGGDLVTTAFSKGASGDLPTLSTGEKTAEEILRARVEAIFAGGFTQKIARNDVMDNTGNYYIVNYWSLDHYNWKHINGAIQYTPASKSAGITSDLTLDNSLKTLPTDKKIVVYCYTGQTSSQVTAYLAVLGYDAYSLLYGVNGIDWDNMPGTRFVEANDVKNYELVQ